MHAPLPANAAPNAGPASPGPRTAGASAASLAGRTVLQAIPALQTGGAERTALDVAAAVVAAGGRALVASAGGRLVEALRAAGAEHLALPVGRKDPLSMRANAARLADIVEREGVDLLHARSRAPAWAGLLAARWTVVPFVTTYHGAYGQRSAPKAFYNSVMARGDAVIANSAFTADLVARRHPFAQGRIVVIPRGTDLAAFRDPAARARGAALRTAWGVAPGERLVLHLARLTPWKGQAVVLAAIDALVRRGEGDVVAVLAGDDQGRSAYRAQLVGEIERRGLSGRVRLVGHVSDVPAAMAAADLAVVASTEPEAFGRAAVEAQAAGVPVVVSDLGAVRETVLAPPEAPAAARSGWRVPAGDPEALASALAHAFALAPDERAGVGARGAAHAAARFSLEAMTSATLDVYRTLLAGARFC